MIPTDALAYLYHRIAHHVDALQASSPPLTPYQSEQVEAIGDDLCDLISATLTEVGASVDVYADGSPVMPTWSHPDNHKTVALIRRPEDPEDLPAQSYDWLHTPQPPQLHVITGQEKP